MPVCTIFGRIINLLYIIISCIQWEDLWLIPIGCFCSKSMSMQQKSTSQYVKEELRNICNARSEKHLQQQQQQQGMSQGLPPPPASQQTTPSTPQPSTVSEYSELPNYIIEQSKCLALNESGVCNLKVAHLVGIAFECCWIFRWFHIKFWLIVNLICFHVK